MNRRMIAASAAILGLVAVTGHFAAKPLLAQIRAALVKNVDEPGRTPYQSSQHCSPVGVVLLCSGDFTPVPAGKRLVIQHASGLLGCGVASCGGGLNHIQLFSKGHGSLNDDGAFIPYPVVTNIWSAFNEDVRLYIEPGAVPSFQAYLNVFSASITITVTGYLTDLSQ
jgi:hypothetical protein